MQDAFDKGKTHFLEMSGGSVNATELVASLIICKGDVSVRESVFAQERIDGSMSMLVMTKYGIFAGQRPSGPYTAFYRPEGRRSLYFI